MSSNVCEKWYRARRTVVSGLEALLGLSSIPLRADGPVDHKWHQNFILNLASVMRPKNYLELGIYHCGLFNKMIPFADKLTGVDIAPEAGTFMAKSPKVSFACSTTDAYAETLRQKGETFDFIFIDADHSRKAVRSDFTNYIELLRPHGLLLLHDTHPIDRAATDQARCGDGFESIAELSHQTVRWEMMTIPLHPGLTICRKRAEQLSWMEK